MDLYPPKERPGEIEGPATISIRKPPKSLQINKTVPGVTGVMRGWRDPGPRPCGGLCLAGECSLDSDNHCMLVVPDVIPAGECPLFGLIAWRAKRFPGHRVAIDPRPSRGAG